MVMANELGCNRNSSLGRRDFLAAGAGAVAVGLTDNIIRPVLIGKGAKLPVFLLFLGIFGGLQVYGPIGIFLGPLLISCVIVFLQIYREHKNLPHANPPTLPPPQP